MTIEQLRVWDSKNNYFNSKSVSICSLAFKQALLIVVNQLGQITDYKCTSIEPDAAREPRMRVCAVSNNSNHTLTQTIQVL
jgi:hypothetical protein